MHIRRILTFVTGLSLAASATLATAAVTLTRDIDNPDRRPYVETTSFTLTPPFLNNFAAFPTPSGQRVVIEYVVLSCTTPSAADTITQVLLNVTKQVSSTSVSLMNAGLIPMQRVGPAPFGGYIWEGTMLMKSYSDPQLASTDGGTGIMLNVYHSDASQAVGCFATVSGHLVKR